MLKPKNSDRVPGPSASRSSRAHKSAMPADRVVSRYLVSWAWGYCSRWCCDRPTQKNRRERFCYDQRNGSHVAWPAQLYDEASMFKSFSIHRLTASRRRRRGSQHRRLRLAVKRSAHINLLHITPQSSKWTAKDSLRQRTSEAYS